MTSDDWSLVLLRLPRPLRPAQPPSMHPIGRLGGWAGRRGRGRRKYIWSGGDLLSHVLRRSTIGATGLNGRVRDGIGCFPRAVATRPGEGRGAPLSRYGSLARAVWFLRLFQRQLALPLGASATEQAHKTKAIRTMPEIEISSSQVKSLTTDHQNTGSFDPASTEPDQADRAISTGRLNALPRLHLQPIDVVVFHGSQGDLISRGASRLDAFSGYPVRT